MYIHDLPTPSLLIDKHKLMQNIQKLSSHIGALGSRIRPHVKTHKSIDITKAIEAGGNTSGITVSTVKEAEHFFHAGYTDILYAVGVVPNKFNALAALIKQGCDVKVILDSVTAAALLCDYAQSNDTTFKVMIELDVDNHRAGVDPHSKALLEIAHVLNNSPCIDLHGVMTHAGGSYNCFGGDDQLTIARQERDLSLLAAKRIRDCGIACPNVSIGSTPTAFAIDDLKGITEVRAGVYALFDLVMAGLGVCKVDDIAISVLGSIIGFQHEKNIALTDAGWMAMSRDRGTATHEIDYGYGQICELNGVPIDGVYMQSANQEHGIIGLMSDVKATTSSKQGKSPALNMAEHFNIGDFIRVLPNHACSTAAQFNEFYLVDSEKVIGSLPSISGW